MAGAVPTPSNTAALQTELTKTQRALEKLRGTGKRIRADKANVAARAIGAATALVLSELLADYAISRLEEGETDALPTVGGFDVTTIGGGIVGILGVLGITGDQRVDSALAYTGVATVSTARTVDKFVQFMAGVSEGEAPGA